MKKTLLFAATSLALMSFAAPAAAHDGRACIDTACSGVVLFADDTGSASAPDTAVVAAPRMGTWGIDTDGMDTSVSPGEDFFAYVSGNWAETTQIPSDRSSYGSFLALRDLSEARVRQLVESYELGDPATDGDAAKIAAVYQAFMDEEAIDALGAQPLAPYLDAIDRLLALTDKLADRGIELEHFDMGGGLGVVYDKEEPPAPRILIDAVRGKLAGRNLKLVMEPGRSISASAGIFVTRVEFLKLSAHKNFAIVDGAMNDLLRPALYGAGRFYN